MNNHRRNFTPSDDALIRQQPITGMGLKRIKEHEASKVCHAPGR
jgi:hypothetical protein